MSEIFDKDGFLFKRAGSTKKSSASQKKFSVYYFNLVGGSLHYYQHAEDPEPKQTIQLKGLSLVKEEKVDSKDKFAFALRGEGRELVLATEDEKDRAEWTTAIEANLSKDPAPALKKEKRKTRAQELALKFKMNAASKAASSSLGKKAIKSQAPEELRNLVICLRRIVERESKSTKKADEMEALIFKLGIKCYFLIDGGKMKLEELLTADKPLRGALELLAKCHDHAKFSRNPNPKLLLEKFEVVSTNLREGCAILCRLLEPHTKPKNIKAINDALEYLANPERLLFIFTDAPLEEDLQELIYASEHYTQFHFYAN
eukprot:TRINITY_DN19302_c0_g1_i1.p1 TRINITY_DN19302_c0_g1~~TRINITY_DN19302_c0_g1_i1.p1  ORF type:complete len:316 (-),score=102.50 TRINITY_DN19302_c0_g1_i1:171-1118(-)